MLDLFNDSRSKEFFSWRNTKMIVADFNLIIGLLKHFYSPQIILLFQPWPSSKETSIVQYVCTRSYLDYLACE